jgi:uncharacterized protein YegL
MRNAGKIQSLNNAVREALPHMRRVADENPNAEVLVRVLVFSSGARWQVPDPTPVRGFAWANLKAEGRTDLGVALSMLAKELHVPPMTNRALPPVLVLVSDGMPTDDFEGGLAQLMNEPWGKRTVRIAIAIGRDADFEVLERFIGDPKVKPLAANHPDELVRYIHWASTAVLQSASSPRIGSGVAADDLGVPIPAPPPPAAVAPTW